MTTAGRRAAVNGSIAAFAVALVSSVMLVSGRIEEGRGLGYDGKIYASMVEGSLSQGGANTRMRPLVLLTNQLAYDFVFHEPIRTFQAMNVVYSALLAFVLCALLDVYGASTAHKLVFTLNAFATIAVVKMFAFYPVLIDVGAYLWVTLAVYAVVRGRRAAIVATTVLAVLAREFGLVAVLFGVHRDLRQGRSPLAVAATYLPAVAVFFALRQWILSGVDPGRLGIEGGLLSSADVLVNLRYLGNPWFLTALAYFTLTVFGGLSLLLAIKALRGQVRLGGEPEWLTYLAVVFAMATVANADLWRYLAYALPAFAALYMRAFAFDDWRVVAPWTALATVVTQQPWTRMTDVSYFFEWFPMYPVLFGIPDPPDAQFWAMWAVRLALVAGLCIAGWLALRPAAMAVADPFLEARRL